LKPASFKYSVPETVNDALNLLDQHGSEAKILAGGQSLVPILNFRLGAYEHLIDINRISGLSYIRHEKGCLQIGPLTRQRSIETSELVKQQAPLLREATGYIAHLPIRTRGTIGGSISHAEPAAEDPAVMLALDAEFDIASRRSQRTVKAEEFFRGPMQTALASDELLMNIRIPVGTKAQTFAFDEVSRRRGDFAIIGFATALTWQDDHIVEARIAVCGTEAGAIRLKSAEKSLEGRKPSGDLVRAAAEEAARSVRTQDDIHASAEYRRHLVCELGSVVLARAVQARQ
jgi:CO/xanthine dehydrogenase FAD-binding subunit